MHPDLPKLLDVQSKDRRLADLATRLAEFTAEETALDAAVEAARVQLENSRRQAADSAAKRDDRETKLEAQRALQERRRLRLEQERNPRVAAQLMADVDLARGILTQEESEWMRLAEEATQRENAVKVAEGRVNDIGAEQEPLRADLTERARSIRAEHAEARTERDAAASGLDRALRTKYDRLRGSRRKEVLVPAVNDTCTACMTLIPRSRIGQLRADGLLIEGCEMCGAILYLEEVMA
jgi:predicted  nucleic acid-binding Zn-ribbon protein